jgi:hypothetical protein
LVATFRTSADRRTLTEGSVPLTAVNDAAVHGSAAHPESLCSRRHDKVSIAPPPGTTLSSLIITLTVTPLERGCLIEWRAEGLPFKATNGEVRRVEFRGAAIADADFELVASHSGYRATGVGGEMSGHRGVFLLSAQRGWQGAAARLTLPGYETRRPGGARPRTTLANAAEMFDSARLSAATGMIETMAFAYVEGKANPLPLILGTLYVVDNVSTVLVNAAGAGVLATNWALGTNNATASDIGDRMLHYPGLIGGALQWAAEQIGGQTAGEVTGLAYSAATIFTPQGVERAFATAALEHVLTRGGSAAGQVGNVMIDLGAQSLNVRDWLSWTQLGAQTLDQVVDWISRASGNSNAAALDIAAQQGSSRVSPTPTPRDAMSDTDFAAFLRQLTDPRSPFNQSTAGTFSESTAGLSDVVVSGLLSFLLFDHAIEDGDIVALNVTGGGATAIAATVKLTNAGQIFNTGIGSGQAVISITALNLGDLPPNTGAISVTSPIVSGNGTQIYNLEVGETGLMRILVLGRRARGN